MGEPVDTTRLETFSDGVFAIAITLLVIAIELPHEPGPMLAALVQLWPSYLAYAMSFLVIGAIWINHHGMFQYIARTDNGFLLINLLQLMAISFLPFPTAVLATAISSGHDAQIAIVFYCMTLSLVGVLVNAMWYYVFRHRELWSPRLDDAAVKRISKRFLVGPSGYAFAAIIGYFIPLVAVAIIIALNVFYLWPKKARQSPQD